MWRCKYYRECPIRRQEHEQCDHRVCFIEFRTELPQNSSWRLIRLQTGWTSPLHRPAHAAKQKKRIALWVWSEGACQALELRNTGLSRNNCSLSSNPPRHCPASPSCHPPHLPWLGHKECVFFSMSDTYCGKCLVSSNCKPQACKEVLHIGCWWRMGVHTLWGEQSDTSPCSQRFGTTGCSPK